MNRFLSWSVSAIVDGNAINYNLQVSDTINDRFDYEIAAPQNLSTTAPLPKSVEVKTIISIQYRNPMFLMNSYIDEIEIVCLEDRRILVEDEDIEIDRENGTVMGLKQIPNFLTEVRYTAGMTRKDIIAYERKSGSIKVIPGLERGADVAAYAPIMPHGMIEIARALVTRSRGIDVIHTSHYNNFIKVGDEVKDIIWQMRAKERLPKTLRKLTAGLPLRIAGYGDSLTEQGGGGIGDDFYFKPNGPYRDQIVGGYYQFGRIGIDTLNTQQRYDHNDGAGNVHIHAGWNWKLKAFLESRYLSEIIYDYWGIGGSTSTDGCVNGPPDALNPDRITALINSAPDLVVVQFGMNEDNSDHLYMNILRLIEAITTAGAEVIVIGMAPTPPLAQRRTLKLTRQMDMAMAHAAADALDGDGVAYIPLMRYFDPENIHSIGLSFREINAFGGVHPMFAELNIIGKLLCKPFI